ncbi:MAG: peptidase M23 [Proteobacteria bacterium]|nr:MAG: peptidase M23 [Pseudomonadota bacterium]
MGLNTFFRARKDLVDSCSAFWAGHYDGVRLLACLLLTSILFSGCTSKKIYQDETFNPPVYFGVHVVRKGETLYAIAWRYGRNYKELAAANDIPPPYRLIEGQKIQLELKASPEDIAANYRVTKQKPNITKKNKQTGVNKGRISDAGSSTGNNVGRSADAERLTRMASRINWIWPHPGTVIAKFSVTGSINKGIDIRGESGDSVVAAADGEVVYAGSGLRGYGKLIILNHAHDFISAYAHNKKILVREGEKIKAGERIAELGVTGVNKPKLHFEIRKNGRPANPLNYLPKR